MCTKCVLNIPKQSGKRTDLETSSNHSKEVMTKAETVEQMGYTRHEVSDYQRMAQNQAVTSNGIENTNTVKLGRCIKELERIYGVRSGSAGRVAKDLDGHNVSPKTESDLAEQLDMSTKQLRKYKSLADLIPELQDAVFWH